MPSLRDVDWTDLPPALVEFWTERHLCVLSTLDRHGAPHGVPVGAVLDHELRCAWVITSTGSQKAANLRRDPRLSITQVDGARWSSIVGTARVTDDADEVARAVAQYAGRYRTPRENPERVALRVEVDHFLGSAGVLSRDV